MAGTAVERPAGFSVRPPRTASANRHPPAGLRRGLSLLLRADELAKMREEQAARGENPKYDRRWRDPKTPPPRDVAPAIRFKTPLTGQTEFHDLVKGGMAVENAELDDFVIVRADGTPTYNFACATDDADMRITDVIRGDDHVMNTFKQILVHRALKGEEKKDAADAPKFAHLPMILNATTDESGAPVAGPGGDIKYERMSKRNGAVDVNVYRQSGFLPPALLNYLARLSWSHGDDEKFSMDEFERNFDLSRVQKSPARFDMEKLRWLNREHMREANPKTLRLTGRQMSPGDLDNEAFWSEIRDSDLELTLPRAATLLELRRESEFFLSRPPGNFELMGEYLGEDNRAAFNDLRAALAALPEWKTEAIKFAMSNAAKRAGLKFPRLGMPMRALLTGASESPDIAATAEALGREETLERLSQCENT